MLVHVGVGSPRFNITGISLSAELCLGVVLSLLLLVVVVVVVFYSAYSCT